ncbi:phenylacetate-coenzyme A ligase [Pseudonocardia sulfidoxydans NBRC 16205]|uniref:Phenylacetate-coenzyme A ligase n=1 Tax=Pseudonocardia sulfidoxydans NBRC 16205 TaxID=1223511 RepID=A0A511DED9_9PSEU|nr:AMP-binding protein [Pseudonocardia sulfidoxydans]GEL23152.1 phenylacetate-coenzyme A ligase [Pseudonocardia sulfidoxydans NBRC 16205]
MSGGSRRYVDRATETMSPAELARLQLARLNEFLDRGVWGNEWFAPRLGARREIRSLEQWRELPTMTKRDVMADIAEHGPYGRRATAEPADVRQVVETSGTSGQGRERYPVTGHDLDLIQQMEMPGFAWAGAGPGSVVLSSLPVTTRAGGQWYQDAVRRLGAVWLSVGTYPAEEKLRYLREIGADILVASPSYLMRLEIVAAAEGVRPADLGVRAIMTAGEPFSVAWAREREAVWDARLHEQYGSTQRAIAWSCEEGAVHGDGLGVLHVLPHLAVYEVIDPATGEEVGEGEHGELVITPFGSTAAPLVRFASGDRVVKVGAGDCPCGRPYPGLRCGRIDRYDAMTKIRGVNVVPSAADALLLQHPVTDYQARVYSDERTGREELEIVVAAVGGPPDAGTLAVLADRFRQEFGLRATFVAHEGPTLVADVAVDAKKRKRWTDERAPMRRGAPV